jgi:putative Mn2+ efflux pump MntP
MFNGEKTSLFWVGLLLLGFSSLVLFAAVWQTIVSYMSYLSYSDQYNSSFAYGFVWSLVPIIVGGIIFILIGLYMMKSGVKKEQPNTPKPS